MLNYQETHSAAYKISGVSRLWLCAPQLCLYEPEKHKRFKSMAHVLHKPQSEGLPNVVYDAWPIRNMLQLDDSGLYCIYLSPSSRISSTKPCWVPISRHLPCSWYLDEISAIACHLTVRCDANDSRLIACAFSILMNLDYYKSIWHSITKPCTSQPAAYVTVYPPSTLKSAPVT